MERPLVGAAVLHTAAERLKSSILFPSMKNDTHFRGRKIYVVSQYPTVYWPEHPAAYKTCGLARVHRIVAWEKFGCIGPDQHVHHIDEDKWNWAEGNLVLLSSTQHAQHHKPPLDKVTLFCAGCREPFELRPSLARRRRTCSNQCRAKADTRAAWPDDANLLSLFATESATSLAATLGVSDVAVTKRAKAAAKRLGVPLVRLHSKARRKTG